MKKVSKRSRATLRGWITRRRNMRRRKKSDAITNKFITYVREAGFAPYMGKRV